jgi:PBSX family phage portal protein
MSTPATTAAPAGAKIFSFGKPETVSNRRQLLDHGTAYWNGNWYDPVCNLKLLADLLHLTPYHESAIDAWVNIVSGTLLPSKTKINGKRVLKKKTMVKAMKDYRTFGNAYLYLRRSRDGRVVDVEHLPALYMRRGKRENQFVYLHQESPSYVLEDPNFTYYDRDVVHLKRYDVRQEIYGVPGYLGALDAAYLNREATLLKRQFFVNGAHLGFVFVLSSADILDEDVTEIEEALKDAKGDFGNLFVHLPGEKEGAVKIIPIGDIASKDDFWNVKMASREDVLGQHRVPLILMSIMPTAAGGLGKPQDAALVFARNEVEPFHDELDELNELAGMILLNFQPYSLGSSTNGGGVDAGAGAGESGTT